jgi:hypothetical protein
LISEQKTIHERTAAIIFLGTPHRGSSSAPLAQVALTAAKLVLLDVNSRAVDALAVDGELLDNIQLEFLKMLHTNDFRVYSFQEGRTMVGLKGASRKVCTELEHGRQISPARQTLDF